MGHGTIITLLNGLMKGSSFLDLDVDEHLTNVAGESDRACIIIETATIEGMLLALLERKMVGLNSDEKGRIFDFRGPLGTFSSRILLSQALGIVDRQGRKKLEVLKAMRNAAAHANVALTFDNSSELREGANFILPDHVKASVGDLLAEHPRVAFSIAVALFASVLAGDKSELPVDREAFLRVVSVAADMRLRASRDKRLAS